MHNVYSSRRKTWPDDRIGNMLTSYIFANLVMVLCTQIHLRRMLLIKDLYSHAMRKMYVKEMMMMMMLTLKKEIMTFSFLNKVYWNEMYYSIYDIVIIIFILASSPSYYEMILHTLRSREKRKFLHFFSLA